MATTAVQLKTAMRENDLAGFWSARCANQSAAIRRTTYPDSVLAEKLPKWRLRPCTRDGPQILVFSLVADLSVASVHVRRLFFVVLFPFLP